MTAGHEMRAAYDGPAALELARVRPHDVVLMDIGMPGMDGLEVARRLRQHLGLMQALLVALTRCDDEEDRRCSQEAGFDAHLVNPAQPLDLVCLLARPFDLQRLNAETPDGRQRLVPGTAAERGMVSNGTSDLVGTRPKT